MSAAELTAARASGSPHRLIRETDQVGRLGVERQYDLALRGEPGIEFEATGLSGRVLARRMAWAPTTGRDVVLTLDAAIQASAEVLLDAALARNRHANSAEGDDRAGGAVVVLDVKSGAILAAASAPRFEPAAFQDRQAERMAYLSDPAAPLVDRATKMALPPGSVFKVVTAIALLEQEIVRPHEMFDCQGYLRDPSRERCAIFTRHGEGHGPVSLETALAQSCNVYFFHQAEKLGSAALIDWGKRCGFGKRTGVDLPDEASGNLPAAPEERSTTADREASDDEVRAAAIGQGTVTATPLQVARLMAAVANGGKLVTPHVVSGWGLTVDPQSDDRSDMDGAASIKPAVSQSIPELHTATLETIRRALVRVVADPEGSAHPSVFLEGLSIAGKTGTAETGRDQADHAWFAGYAPAESPRVAFAVALEHGGGGGEAAGPVARRLVQRLAQLGYLGRSGVQRASHQLPVE